MSYGQTEIYNALNQTGITGLLDNYRTGVKALFSARLIPQDFTGTKSINFYMSSPRNMGDNYEQYIYSINCRAGTYGEAIVIGKAVIDNINRTSYTDYYTVCQALPVLPPLDDTDVYNFPIEVTLKKR